MSKKRSTRRLGQAGPNNLRHCALWLAAAVFAWSCCTTTVAWPGRTGCQESGGAARECLALSASHDELLERIANSVLEVAVDCLEHSSAGYLLSEIVAFCQQGSTLDPETYRRWAAAEDRFGAGDLTPLHADAVFHQRLQFYGDCLQKWVQHEAELSADQAQLLSQQVQLQIDAVLPRRAKLSSERFDAFMPILFGERVATEIESVLQPKALALLQLSDTQSQRLQTALVLRRRRLARDDLSGLLFRIDSEMFLSQEQMLIIAQEAAGKIDLSPAGFGFLRSTSSDDPERNLESLLRTERAAKTLSVHQLALLQDLVVPEEDIVMTLGELRAGTPGMLEPFTDRRSRLHRAQAAAYLDMLQNDGVINAESAMALRMTSGLCADRKLQDWRRQQFDWCRDLVREGDTEDDQLMMLLLPPRESVFTSDEFQVPCCLQPGYGPALLQRVGNMRLRLAHFCRGLLDRELWLTTEQRTFLTSMLRTAILPEWTTPAPNKKGDDCWALACFLMAVDKVAEQRPHKLSQEQIRTLVTLRRLFWLRADDKYLMSVAGSQADNSCATRFLD